MYVLQRHTRLLSEYRYLPSFFGRRMLGGVKHLSQSFSLSKGDGITLFPARGEIGFGSAVREAVTNPQLSDMERYIAIGRRMGFQKGAELKARLFLETRLKEAIHKVETY